MTTLDSLLEPRRRGESLGQNNDRIDSLRAADREQKLALPTPATSANARLAVWSAELATLVFVDKLVAVYLGAPSDAVVRGRNAGKPGNAPTDHNVMSKWEIGSDLQTTLMYGLILGWIIGLAERERFGYLYSRRRWWFHLLLLLSGPAFSLVELLPFMQHSVSPGAPTSFLLVVGLIGVGLVVLSGWHLLYGWRNERARFAEWLLSILAVFGFYALYLALLIGSVSAQNGQQNEPLKRANHDFDGGWHIHHWWIAWSAGLGCRWSHAASATALALAVGVFVEGIAVYEAAPLVADTSCVYFHAQDDAFDKVATRSVFCNSSSPAGFVSEVCFYRGRAVHRDHPPRCVFIPFCDLLFIFSNLRTATRSRCRGRKCCSSKPLAIHC